MTLLVISDSHGRCDNIEKAIERNRNASAILFLGDGIRDVELLDTYGIETYCVRGNCDLFGASSLSVPEERILRFGEYNIMMMHGHTKYVKDSPLHAIAHAARSGADILLFGHTHLRHEQYISEGEEILGVKLEKPLWVFNPGSIGKPISSGYSFGTIGIRGRNVLTSFGNIS